MHFSVRLFVHVCGAQLNADQTAFQRRFTKEISRIGEIERKTMQLENMMLANNVTYIKIEDLPVEENEASADVLDRLEVLLSVVSRASRTLHPHAHA